MVVDYPGGLPLPGATPLPSVRRQGLEEMRGNSRSAMRLAPSCARSLSLLGEFPPLKNPPGLLLCDGAHTAACVAGMLPGTDPCLPGNVPRSHGTAGSSVVGFERAGAFPVLHAARRGVRAGKLSVCLCPVQLFLLCCRV